MPIVPLTAVRQAIKHLVIRNVSVVKSSPALAGSHLKSTVIIQCRRSESFTRYAIQCRKQEFVQGILAPFLKSKSSHSYFSAQWSISHFDVQGRVSSISANTYLCFGLSFFFSIFLDFIFGLFFHISIYTIRFNAVAVTEVEEI